MCEQYYKIKMNNFDVSLDFLSMKGKGDIQIIPVASGSGFIAPVIGGIFSAGAAVVSTAATAVTAVAGTALSVANTVAGAAVGTVATVANTAAGAVVAGAGAIASEVGTTGILGAIATTVATNVVVDGVTSLIAPTLRSRHLLRLLILFHKMTLYYQIKERKILLDFLQSLISQGLVLRFQLYMVRFLLDLLLSVLELIPYK